MKQLELIKQMGQSVIKLGISIVFLLVFSEELFCQRISELNRGQYEILENTYRKAKEKTIPVHYQTIKFESWMELLWDEDNFSQVGVGFCSFKDSEVKLAFLELKNRIAELDIKRIDRKKLSKKIMPTKRKKGSNISFLSEAIIIGDYSFVFDRNLNQKSLHVLKKDTLGIWNYECGVPLQFELH